MKLTPKENFLKVMHHEIPESIPLGSMGFPVYNGERDYAIVGPTILDEVHSFPGQFSHDRFGLEWITSEGSMGGLIPDVSHIMLDDIRKWRDVLKTPNFKDVDWEKQYEKDVQNSKWNPETEAKMAVVGLMPFQQLAGFMGFVGALTAMFEEPEEVKELLNWMVDCYMPGVDAALSVYKPDCMYFLDDTCARYNPFFSVEMYKDIFKPVYERLCGPFRDAGIPIQYHNCGRCEDFLDDAVDLGVCLTDPMQVENDIAAVKAKYGRKLAICGGMEYIDSDYLPNFNEEEVRAKVRENIDFLAKDGGYVCSGARITGTTGMDATKANEIMAEECYYYCQDYYNKH